jgi:hypothetical protein
MSNHFQPELFEAAVGSCGALVAELMHWHRIAIRGRWPKYSRSWRYWLITGLVIVASGAVTATVSAPGSSLLQLMLVGISGPELLYSLSRSRVHEQPDKRVYLGAEPGTWGGFLAT